MDLYKTNLVYLIYIVYDLLNFLVEINRVIQIFN